MVLNTEINTESQTKNQLEKWKKHLIDFSKRNQLLYFKSKPTMTVEFKDQPVEIFSKLVFQSKSLDLIEEVQSFNTQDFGTEDLLPIDPDSLEPGMTIEEAFMDDMSPMMVNPEARDLGSGIQTNRDFKTLEQALSKLKQRSFASLQEQGVNILYVALYMLDWQDTKDQTNIKELNQSKSPLILLPVSLSRKGMNGAFKLSIIEDEIRINPTLSYKLHRDYGVDLSNFEERINDAETEEEFVELIAEVRKKITQDYPSWNLADESCLSLFSFAKLSMYRDLEVNEDKIINHPLIRQVAGELLRDEDLMKNLNTKFLVKSKDIDTKLDANLSKQILDADSSQEEAINASKAGVSFVIQGPPGTGKSQTISNIIAEALSQNKKILFVSEKRSALEVVINRLKESKLDKFCLELHNSQRKKSEVLDNLRISLEEIKSMALANYREEYIEDLNKIKANIQEGIDELHKIREPIQRSLYEIYGEIAKIKLQLKQPKLNFTIPYIEKIDLQRLSELDFLFKNLANHKKILGDYDSFLWRNANVNNLSFDVENEIKSNLIEFKNIINKLESYANPISEKYFARKINNLKEFKWLAEASNLASNSPFPKKDWFNHNKLNDIQLLTIEAKIEHEEYSISREKILSKYSENFLNLDHAELLTKFTQKFTGIFRFFNIEYWKDVNQIKKMALYNEAKNLQTIIADLEQAALLDKKAVELSKDKSQLSLELGDFYKEFNTDWDETITAIKWVQKVMGKFDSDQLPTSLVNVISEPDNLEDFKEFEKQVADLNKAYDLVKYYVKFYKSIFPYPNIDLENISFHELSEHIESLISNIVEIEDWIEFKQLEAKAEKLGMAQFLSALLEAKCQNITEEFIRNNFMYRLYQLWVDKIELENSMLRKFSGQTQQLLIDKFNDNDQKIIERNKHEIAKRLALNWIEYANNVLNKADLQIMNHEINKKKKHKPIRVLIREIPELLQTIKPCWMMSPLSVSQLIEAGNSNNLEFDLVIFDEASQIRTEDAISSIYRGKQLILAGDSNQLPPTNFFNYISDDDDYENSSFESVLDECAVFLQSRTLNWHYRSRHEDLIKFSNYHIYDNQLVTFPSPISKSQNLGVDFELIDKGLYERGARYNKKEAARVAEAIVQHYLEAPNLSLGVIAFSEAQQFAIERELAKELRKNFEVQEQLAPMLDEERVDSLFIKNLENVQGDERDVIFFSIGYARDKQGNLSHNFGPLNREGGHRRLNVAVTRARNKLKVFSSIIASDIDLNRTSAQGAVLLKKYLAFAEESSLKSSAESQEESSTELSIIDSRISQSSAENKDAQIEDSIASVIESMGYSVERFLGASEYKIDIAVRSIKNPEEFILAIETDGAVYRSAHTCRDRERLRKQVLHSLGWKTHRIWSRDWIRNQEDQIKQIKDLLDNSN
jgi:superfamily I DNA and/or RNA helicase/very-short-patch-repair endonuclease